MDIVVIVCVDAAVAIVVIVVVVSSKAFVVVEAVVVACCTALNTAGCEQLEERSLMDPSQSLLCIFGRILHDCYYRLLELVVTL